MDILNYKLAVLDKRVKGFISGFRQNIVFLGDDSDEISYLLDKYLSEEGHSRLICVHTASALIDSQQFFKSVIFSFFSEYLSQSDNIDSLINCVDSIGSMPNTVKFIKKALGQDNVSFEDVLEVINKFIEETSRKCLFIIEEFLDLPRIFHNFYEAFSKFLILQRECMVILTASQVKEAEHILSGQLNLLFGNFEKVLLTSNDFINNYIHFKKMIAPLSPSPFFISFFINIIGSNMFYYDLVAQVIKDNFDRDHEEDSIAIVLEKVLYAKESFLFQKFNHKMQAVKDEFKDYASVFKVLFYLSQGYLRKRELASLKVGDSREISFKLQKLGDFNYVRSMGDIYKIKDSVFSFWVAHIFKLWFLPPVLNSQKRKQLWRQSLNQEIVLFKEDLLKDKVKKVLELITSFKDDIFKSQNLSYRLPAIKKTKIISYPEKNSHFIVGEGRQVVLVGVKESEVFDSDIFDFLDKSKNIKGKGVRKIFIGLDHVAEAAKLIAKSNKLILWDLNEISGLLKAYNKPIISFK